MGKNKIKLLVDGHTFDGIFQGSRTFLKGLYSELAHSDQFEIHIAANNVNNLEREFADAKGDLKFVELKSKTRAGRLLLEYPSIVDRYNIDYAHFHYIAPIKTRCRTVLTIHDVLFMEFEDDFSWIYKQRKYAFKRSAQKADIITASSEYSRKAINRYLGTELSKINIVRPALESVFFKTKSDEEIGRIRKFISDKYGIERYILYVSRIEPRKAHELLLRACLELELYRKNIHLVFVGKTALRNKKLEELIESMSEVEKKYFHHLENIDYKGLLQFMSAADLFVYPSRGEGFGYPPLESAAMGVETILADSTSLSEFEFFENRFFDPGNVNQLKDKITLALDNARNPLLVDINHVRSKIASQYHWGNSADKFERLILEDFYAAR